MTLVEALFVVFMFGLLVCPFICFCASLFLWTNTFKELTLKEHVRISAVLSIFLTTTFLLQQLMR